MERCEYLKACQRFSMCKETEPIPKDIICEYNGSKYYPFEFKFSFKNGDVIDRAILKDRKANAVVECNLSKVSKVEEKQ